MPKKAIKAFTFLQKNSKSLDTKPQLYTIVLSKQTLAVFAQMIDLSYSGLIFYNELILSSILFYPNTDGL